jgi:hypothetical protein
MSADLPASAGNGMSPLPLPTHLDTRDLPTEEIAGSFVRIHHCCYSAPHLW